jgi:hypothetical protein
MNIYKVGGFLEAQLNVNDFEIVGNTLQTELNLNSYLSDFADYYVNFTNDLVLNGLETIELTNDTDWTFTITRGDFKDSDFLNTDFLIYT